LAGAVSTGAASGRIAVSVPLEAGELSELSSELAAYTFEIEPQASNKPAATRHDTRIMKFTFHSPEPA
jgi:hypothetical protein